MDFESLVNEYGRPMVVACGLYRGGKRVADLKLADAKPVSAEEGGFIWIGLHEPCEEMLQHLAREFDLHPLAIEDAHRAHQRPKIDVYGEAIFVVLRTAQLQHQEILYGETHIFVGKGYVISVRHGASNSYTEVRKRCERDTRMLAHGEDYVLYAILDFVADQYFPVIDQIVEEVNEIESHIVGHCITSAEIDRIYELRRELTTFRRRVTPMLELCNRLERYDLPMIDREIHPYYRDVHDHVTQVNESIDSLRESLSSAYEAAVMISAASQNEVTKKLAGWAAILAIPTAIAGIYGMNFEHMPELKWAYGYFTVLGGMGGVCGYLYYRFRKAGWL